MNDTLIWGAGAIDADPLFVEGPDGFHYLSQIAAGQGINSPCVGTGSDQAANVIGDMDTLWTRTDEVPDSGVVDMGYHYGNFVFPGLQVNVNEVSASSGGIANFILNATSDNQNRNYFQLGSVTGTTPGFPLPGGLVTLPLNWDIFTGIVYKLANTPAFLNFHGQLDASGHASTQFNTLGPLPPTAVGITMNFAYLFYNRFDFVSNPIPIEIVP